MITRKKVLQNLSVLSLFLVSRYFIFDFSFLFKAYKKKKNNEIVLTDDIFTIDLFWIISARTGLILLFVLISIRFLNLNLDLLPRRLMTC